MGYSSSFSYIWHFDIELKDVVVTSAETRQGIRFKKQSSPCDVYF